MTNHGTIESLSRKDDLSNSQSFPLKLMSVLSMEEFKEVSQWTATGKAFRIIDPDRFEAEVMVVHFKRAKFASFLRKLRRWGFSRIYRGPDSGAYFHKCFQRGNIAAILEMSCLKREPSTVIKCRQKAPKVAVSRAFSQLPVVKYEGSTPRLVRGNSASLPKPPVNASKITNPLLDFEALSGLDVACLLQERSDTFRGSALSLGDHVTRAMVDASALMFLHSQPSTVPSGFVPSDRTWPPLSLTPNQHSDMSAFLPVLPPCTSGNFHV